MKDLKPDITEFAWYRAVTGQYTDSFIKTSRCVKLNESDDEVCVAAAQNAADDIGILTLVHSPKKIRVVQVKEADFAEFVGKYVEGVSDNISSRMNDEAFCLENINSDAPVVNVINAICLEAIRKRASDIHIQGTKEGINVRLRIDGVLKTVRTLSKNIFDNLVSRIKIMADLNVMENRLCQDGRMSVQAGGRKLDFRVSIVPSVCGQDVVLRLFDAEGEILGLDELGFSKDNLNMLKDSLRNPYGMILVTGPTGSGKTTTLHAMIKSLNMDLLKIVTIEDPVEKIIDGAEQIQVNEGIGLGFETILRRILRQDPDVIMVGEIRDPETAALAVRSALTGHLILSTIHTNDSLSAVSRLRNLGIEPYLIAGTLRAVLAQRLVRKSCHECSGKGCTICSFTGYSGRTAVSEVFLPDEEASMMIGKCASDYEIRRHMTKLGFRTLREDAMSKLKDGISTESEMVREGLL